MYVDPSEIFYMDIGAVNVIVASEVAPGGIPVCKYFKKIKLIEEKRNTTFIAELSRAKRAAEHHG